MIDNNDIKTAVESVGLHYALVVNAAELETCVHEQMPDDDTDLVVNFVDTNSTFHTNQTDGRTYETRSMLLIFYNRVEFDMSRDALVEGAAHEGQVVDHKANAANVIAALNASGHFAGVTDWACSVHPFETTDVLNGLWVTFNLADTIGDCAK